MAKVTNTITPTAEALAAQAPQAIAQALFQQAHEIIADSVTNYVPKDTGTLANSARVEPPMMSPREVSVSFGFGGPSAPYALFVHEHPRSGKTGGVSPQGKKYPHWARTGQWKYLETPLKAKAPQAVEELRNTINHLLDSNRAKRLAYATGF